MKKLRFLLYVVLIGSAHACMRSAVRVKSGENPFTSGNVVFEGSIVLNVLEPKRLGAVEHANGVFSDNVSAWSTSDFKLRFIAEDGKDIVCPVNEGKFGCILPQGRYKYFLLQGLNLSGIGGMVTSKVKLNEFLQWFRVPEQAMGTGVTNYLGTIVIEHYPDFQLNGMDIPLPNATPDVLKLRPEVVHGVKVYLDPNTKNEVRRVPYLKFREGGTFTRIDIPTDSQKREILTKYPSGTTMQTVELQPHSRACFGPSMVSSKKPMCGYGFMNNDFANKSQSERFDE